MDLNKLYQEMTTVIADELNFHKELQNGIYFQQRYKLFPDVKIPNYYAEHCTRRVLVMEWIEGAKITDIAYLEQHRIDRHTLAKRLFNIFLEQLLKEGKFHADPHPGNVLVTADGTIVLIDFGMVGSIKQQDTLAIRELVEGIILEDYNRVIEALAQLRFLLPHADKEMLKDIFARAVQMYVEQDFTQLDERLVQSILEDVRNIVRDEAIQMPSELAFFGRAVSTFLGVLYAIDPNVKILELSKPLIQQWIAAQTDRAEGKSTSLSWLKLIQQYASPLLRLPRQLEEVLNEPKRMRQWEQKKEYARLSTSFQQSRKNDTMIFILLSFCLLFAGIFTQQRIITYSGITLLAISIIMYGRTVRTYIRLIKQLERKDE